MPRFLSDTTPGFYYPRRYFLSYPRTFSIYPRTNKILAVLLPFVRGVFNTCKAVSFSAEPITWFINAWTPNSPHPYSHPSRSDAYPCCCPSPSMAMFTLTTTPITVSTSISTSHITPDERHVLYFYTFYMVSIRYPMRCWMRPCSDLIFVLSERIV